MTCDNIKIFYFVKRELNKNFFFFCFLFIGGGSILEIIVDYSIFNIYFKK